MAGPSVSNTFTNSTTADATQVNTNFTDLINGATDGTKDYSISALTCAGNATFNGNTTIGNASSDTLTVTASLASSIPIGTTYSYDIGSSALGLRNLYLGSTDSAAYTVKLSAPVLAAAYTFKFPTSGGTSGHALTTDGSGNTSWTNPVSLAADTRNFLLNSDFSIWQRGTSTTVANTVSTYQADRWYVKNSLGTNGVITYSRQTGTVDGAKYGAKVLISTAPTASQVNGTELYQVLENFDSLAFYNKSGSFSIYVLAFGNVNQVGVQFYYKTTEAKVDTSIGSEQTFTVNTSTATLCSISGQAMGTSFTTSGVVGVRIRITGVSSGNTYDLNNGFQCELGQMNIGTTPATWRRAYPNMGDELVACERFYEKSYDIGTAPGTASADGWVGINGFDPGSAQKFVICFYKATKRSVATVVHYDYAGNSGKCSIEDAGGSVTSNQTVALNYYTSRSFMFGAANGTHTGLISHWTADAEI